MMEDFCHFCSGFVILTTAAENSVTDGEFDVVPVAYKGGPKNNEIFFNLYISLNIWKT